MLRAACKVDPSRHSPPCFVRCLFVHCVSFFKCGLRDHNSTRVVVCYAHCICCDSGILDLVIQTPSSKCHKDREVFLPRTHSYRARMHAGEFFSCAIRGPSQPRMLQQRTSWAMRHVGDSASIPTFTRTWKPNRRRCTSDKRERQPI